ncbi:Predicted lipid-binding transport protein, Tim44 family [Rhizobiales bacterium GAS191]|jgi:predicted lipid-binding transport protein (Tim44 family)|nr:Predicted lipid-binding transport protein, Tim44 family [Rhizobiales bacterium GAS113]SEC15529.1 Predicted lipid-binding transport protein, Tim44 family [Rhizobiales bacterium GAS191]SED05523.1 Predicted lipid-binding transport protein, Tim44 family [Rhizobiales bacterium GAS188]
MFDSIDATTVVFLALAVFVVLRLRSVLGQRPQRDAPPRNQAAPAPLRRDAVGQPGNVIPLATAANDRGPSGADAANPDRWKGTAEPGTPLAGALDTLDAVTHGFDPAIFLAGARGAYEITVTSFAKGDSKRLRDLLSPEVFEGFSKAIADREARGEKVEMTLVSIDDAKILDAQVKDNMAQVTVRFASKLITATRDRDGKVVDGNPEKVADVTDVWTFARDTRSQDPNWQLVATETSH